MDMAHTAKRHSTTLLLYLVPRVNNLGEAVHELAITRQTESGILTSVTLMAGTKSISLACPISPIMDIVWSMPPQAVPAILSALMVISASLCRVILSLTPLACIVVTAAQTTNAELELSPEAGGT